MSSFRIQCYKLTSYATSAFPEEMDISWTYYPEFEVTFLISRGNPPAVQSTTVFRPLSIVSLFVSRYIKHTPGRCTATAAVARLVVCHMFYACPPKDRRWARYANLSFGPSLALKSHQQLYTSLSCHWIMHSLPHPCYYDPYIFANRFK